MNARDVTTFERCMADGGVAVFPADTVYGLACQPDSRDAVARLYALKGRAPEKPSAVMFFSMELALAALPELGERTAGAVERLLPGAVTLLVPNRSHRFRLGRVDDPDTLGIRVPALDGELEPLRAVRAPVLQSSANLAGEPDPRRLADVPAPIRGGVDLVLDGGELPGTPSTVVDLRGYEHDGTWAVARAGAVAPEELAALLDS